MRSEIIEMTNAEIQAGSVLDLAERLGREGNLTSRQAMHLRLLAEETLSLMRAITGGINARFWMEREEKAYQLHLTTYTAVNRQKREELLGVSTTGKNEAASGVIGMLRDIVERALEPAGDYVITDAGMGWIAPMAGVGDAPPMVWSMVQYKSDVQENQDTAGWEKLEKSIVASIADDVRISIHGNSVEMVIYKKFKEE